GCFFGARVDNVRNRKIGFGPHVSIRMMAAMLLALESLESRRLFSLPAGWTDLNIGGPALAGAANVDAGTGVWTQTGGGADIWNRSDQFNFASEHFNGSAVAIADVKSVSNSNTWAKAGLMFRN